MKTTLYLALFCLSLLTVLPLLTSRHWVIRALDFPRLQIASGLLLTGLLGLVYGLATGQLWTIWWLFFVFVLAMQLWHLFPYTSIFPKQVASAPEEPVSRLPEFQPDHENDQTRVAHDAGTDSLQTLSLLTSNVLMTNRNSAALLDTITAQSPDIVAIVESDYWWQEQLDALEGYPYRMACPLENMYGMHLYSRMPLFDTHVEFLVEQDVPSFSVKLQLGRGAVVHLHLVHPRPPAPQENLSSTERDVELLVLAEALRTTKFPVIVAGDLNDVAWSRTTRLFKKISGLRDPRIGRGLYNSFHADYWFARWPLDHVFVSQHFNVLTVRRLGYVGSDHFPLFVRLQLDAGTIKSSDANAKLDSADKNLIKETMDTPAGVTAEPPTV